MHKPVKWILMLAVVCVVAAAAADQPKSAAEYYAQFGGPSSPPPSIPGTPGTLWSNGPTNSVNGLSSERATFTAGTGGPEGDHISTIANDFVVGTRSRITEIRVCLYHTGTTAEMYLYSDAAGNPGPAVTAPIFGGPTGPSVVSTTYTDNTTRCASAFGFPGREYRFSPATTGVTFPTLEPGRYWLAAIGQGGTRAFWADSNGPGVAGPTGRWGSTVFAKPYWSDTTPEGQQAEFAFDIDGVPVSVLEIPTLSLVGLAALVALLALASFIVLRRRTAAR